MTELRRHDNIDTARVENAETRQTRFQEKVEAERNTGGARAKEEADDPAAALDRASVPGGDAESEAKSGARPEDEAEETTDAALHLAKESCMSSKFEHFLINIHIGFARAGEERNELSEVFTEVARDIGLRAGWTLDACTVDDEGNPWDFTKLELKNKAIRKVLKDEPLVLLGSPPCTEWSTVMNVNWPELHLKRRSFDGG